MADAIGYAVRGIEPKGDPDWFKVGAKGQRAFWDVVGKAGLKAKDRSLAKGLDKNGRLLKGISQPTRMARNADINPVSGKGPYSPMGRAFGAAPPLMATGDMSRTRQWLRYEIVSGGVWFYWDHNWGKVLARHARGYTQRFRYPFHSMGDVPPRDVIGLSNADMATVKRLANEWWGLHKREFLPVVPPAGAFQERMMRFFTPTGVVNATFSEAQRLGISHLPSQFAGPKLSWGPPQTPPIQPQTLPFIPKPGPLAPAAVQPPLRPTGTAGQSPFFPHPPGRVPPSPHEMLARQRREMMLELQRFPNLVKPATPPKQAPTPPLGPPSTPPPVKPWNEAEYQRPASLWRAQKIAKEHGVELVPEGYKELRSRYDEFKVKGVSATYLASIESVLINERDPHWARAAESAKEAFDKGMMSSPHPDHSIHHEIGHALHHKAIGTKPFHAMVGQKLTEAQAEVARKVSWYASTEQAEFVAETFAGMKSGRTYPKEVMDLYAHFKGPIVPKPELPTVEPGRVPVKPRKITKKEQEIQDLLRRTEVKPAPKESVAGFSETNYQRPDSIKRAAEIAKTAGIEFVPEGYKTLAEETKQFEVAGTVAGYVPNWKKILVNERHPSWYRPGDAQVHYDIGFHSTPSPDHTTHHEIGHALHHQGIGDEGFAKLSSGSLSPEHWPIARKVSTYATTNIKEFVAETYVGILHGNKYPEDVMALYESLGGPKVKP